MSTSGLEYLDQLKIGMPELSWLQAEILERMQDYALLSGSQEYGWDMRHLGSGRADSGWEVRTQSGGKLRIRSQLDYVTNGATSPYHPTVNRRADRIYVGIDQDHRILRIPRSGSDTLVDVNDDDIEVPDDGVWRTLICRYRVDKKAPGTLNLTAGSTTVTGVGTDFTRYMDGTDPRATKIRIASTDTAVGNEGSYSIATITDATNMTLLTPAPATEASVPFRIQGEFFGDDPADPDIHNTASVYWELVTRTVAPPGDGLIAYDVMYDSGSSSNVQLIDRRHAQQVRNRGAGPHGFELVTNTSLTVYGFATGGAQDLVCAAPADGGSALDSGTAIGNDSPNHLLVVGAKTVSTNHEVNVFEVIPYAGTKVNGPDHTASSPYTIFTASGLLNGICIEQIPRLYGNTHLLFYTEVSGNTIEMRSTTDNGVSGSWSSASTIFTPGAGDTVKEVASCLTRLGRLIVVFTYELSGGDSEIRYIYSDDYGTTWNVNGTDGYTIRAESGQTLEHPDIAEDDSGQVWTAWKRNDDEIRLAVGENLNDPDLALIAAQQPLRGYIVNLQGTTVTARSTIAGKPRLLCGPGSEVHVFYEELDSTTYDVTRYRSRVSSGRIIECSAWDSSNIYNGDSVNEYYGDHAVQALPGGSVWVIALLGYSIETMVPTYAPLGLCING